MCHCTASTSTKRLFLDGMSTVATLFSRVRIVQVEWRWVVEERIWVVYVATENNYLWNYNFICSCTVGRISVLVCLFPSFTHRSLCLLTSNIKAKKKIKKKKEKIIKKVPPTPYKPKSGLFFSWISSLIHFNANVFDGNLWLRECWWSTRLQYS